MALTVGATFNNSRQIQELCRAVAREEGKAIVIKKSDKARVVVTCRDFVHCSYRVRATFASVQFGKVWKITKLNDVHTCDYVQSPQTRIILTQPAATSQTNMDTSQYLQTAPTPPASIDFHLSQLSQMGQMDQMDVSSGTLQIGSTFNDGKEIQHLCRSVARQEGKTVRVKKSDKNRLVVTCQDEVHCPYRVRATFSSIGSGKIWKITKMVDFHTCENTHTPIPDDSPQMPDYVDINGAATVHDIQQVIAAREAGYVSGAQDRRMNPELYKDTLEYELLMYAKLDPRVDMTCGRCLEYGHRQRDCFKELSCGRCGEKGHVNRTCPNEFVSIPTLHGQQPYVDWA